MPAVFVAGHSNSFFCKQFLSFQTAFVFHFIAVCVLFVTAFSLPPAPYIGFAARLTGLWSNGHFIAVVLHLGWTNIAGLLFVNLYFYIFNQQRFRAGRTMNSSPAASPARKRQCFGDTSNFKLTEETNRQNYV